MAETERIAVVLFNLGGPDNPAAVRPFLFNLFNDRAIIDVPAPLRQILAALIVLRRAPVARAIYDRIGGRSPLLDMTREQAKALEERLAPRVDARVFIAMRYWHPRAAATARAVKDFAPDRVVLLPLYPQFSTTTTASSLANWALAADRAGLQAPTHAICCYPGAPGWIAAVAARVRETLRRLESAGGGGGGANERRRFLFSAHGLPEKIISAGDPYRWQIEETAAALAAALGLGGDEWTVCFQSRVGPLRWIGPSLDEELECAAADGIAVVVVPIAFVSEHSETLVELDMEYRDKAENLGVPGFTRVATVGIADDFIACLADLVEGARNNGAELASAAGARICPPGHAGCPLAPPKEEEAQP